MAGEQQEERVYFLLQIILAGYPKKELTPG